MNQISNVSNVNLTLRPGVPTQVRGKQAVSFHCIHLICLIISPPLISHVK